MKLAKISLAALVALGAFSSVASATPLEEAIKNVDVSGFARYRYDVKQIKSSDSTEAKEIDRGHKFRITTDFKAAIDDNFFGVLGIRYNSKDDTGNIHDKTSADDKFGVYQLYLGYTAQNTTITAGKQILGTFFTDDEVGTGIKIVNNDIEGLTLAALAFDALDYDTYEADGGLLATAGGANDELNEIFRNKAGLVNNEALTYKPGNLYGVAAIGSYDPIGFQLWYATLTQLVDIAAIELTGDFNITDDVNVGVKAQYAHSDADKKAKKAFTDAVDISYGDGNFYAGELSTSLFGADLSAGYIGYKASGKGYTTFSLEDQGSYINPGELFSDFVDYTLVDGKGSFWFVTAGYTFDDKYFIGAEYIDGNKKTADNTKEKYKEVVGRLGYNYSKKLEFSSFYAHAQVKEKNVSGKNKADHFRFQAKYSF
ncbi:major outer membrane protein [Campylobacter suis]|uniref:Major outer membrane protein n=1 Tax=Campylobacter suis TaxID=2790657 RepID=A0ABM8Q8D7_9BACT|nr:major outer membrane protein [Campylobacter suis]CAD7289154.1 Major outer membrane protein [Campylobacter suis]